MPITASAKRLVHDGRVRAVVIPYVLARGIVLLSLVLTRHVFRAASPKPLPIQARMGLLGWDAAWYRDIAHYGYDGVAKVGLRFFPLYPLVARAVSWVPGVSVGVATVLVANLFALVAGFLVYELARREGRDAATAQRAVWIMYLAPTAFVLVMGYAESMLMTAALVALLALRGKRWWIAAAAGVIAGLTRPVGVLLAVPALVEVWQSRAVIRRQLLGAVAAVAAPAAGAFAYLLWAQHRTHDFFYPVSVQQISTSRGGWVDPVRAVWRAGRSAAEGGHLSAGIHVVSVAVLVVLIVVLWRRWPASFTAYALVAAVVALSANNLDSLERYSLSTVPLVLAAADVTGGSTRERVVFTVLAATLVACTVLAFSGLLVP